MSRVLSIAVLCVGCRVMPVDSETAIPNPAPEHDTLSLLRQVCTGRTLHEERCAHYQIELRDDGDARWDGFEHVATLGERRYHVAPRELARLHRRLDRALPRLADRGCMVDHTHYVTITIGHAGAAQAHSYRGCELRFLRLAKPIDRVARTSTLRGPRPR